MTRRECNIEGCRRRFSAKGMCRKHYRIGYSKVPPEKRRRAYLLDHRVYRRKNA